MVRSPGSGDPSATGLKGCRGVNGGCDVGDDAEAVAAGGGRSRGGGAGRGPARPARPVEEAAAGETLRYRARGDPDPGEPLLRPLLRDDARRTGLQRPHGPKKRLRTARL